MDLITLLLSSYASSLDTWIVFGWKPNITQTFFYDMCEIPKSLVGILSSTLLSTWKVVILLEIK